LSKFQQAYEQRQQAKKPTGDGESIKADTHRNELAETKTFLRWCYEKGWVSKPLYDGLDRVKGEGKRNKGKPQLRVDEARSWLDQALELAPEEPGAVAALCCFLLGMRASEVVSLVARDVDDQGRLLWISDAKTEAGKRCLEVPEVLRPLLLQLKEERASDSRLFGWHWRDWPCKWVKRICKQAGVPRVSAHGMRGLHATLAIRAGTSSHVVAASLGHSSPKVTEAHYTDRGASDEANQHRVLRVIQGQGQGQGYHGAGDGRGEKKGSIAMARGSKGQKKVALIEKISVLQGSPKEKN
jgi:integrase